MKVQVKSGFEKEIATIYKDSDTKISCYLSEPAKSTKFSLANLK